MSAEENAIEGPTVFGHPAGLFTLFFAEMWERFSYYGMRALLLFYMLKGFLAYGDNEAYKVYGAYTAMVYLTPFFGGFLADRLLGARRAVVFGLVGGLAALSRAELLLILPLLTAVVLLRAEVPWRDRVVRTSAAAAATLLLLSLALLLRRAFEHLLLQESG